MKKWIKRMRWLGLGLVIALLAVLGPINIEINQVQPGSLIGNEYVITLGTEAEAAGVADYTCDGVADDVQFQAAVDALPVGGGRLEVLSGQYNFTATVTKASANITISGVGVATYFANDGITALFTAGGNNWVFSNLQTDAGGITMGATTNWMWTNVNDGTTAYDIRTPAGSIVNGAFTASSLTDTGLTSGRVPLAGAGGLLGDSSNLTFDTATGTLQVSGANVTRSATYVVAASDAPDHVKAQADYVCNGTADEVEINTAFGTGNCTVLLTEGTYTVTYSTKVVTYGAVDVYAALIIPSYTSLIMNDATTITIPSAQGVAGHEYNIIFNSTPLTGNTDILIKGGIIDGNRTNQVNGTQNGIMFDYVYNSTVEDIYIKNIKNWALSFDNDDTGLNPSYRCDVLSSSFTNNAVADIYFDNSYDCKAVGNHIHDSVGSTAIYIHAATRAIVDSNTVTNSGAIYIDSSASYPIITNNHVYDVISGVPGIGSIGLVTGNITCPIINNNTVINTTDDSGIKANYTLGGSISQNVIRNVALRGIQLNDGATRMVVSGNFIDHSSVSSGSTYDNIHLDGATYNNIIGNQIIASYDGGTYAKYGVHFESDANYNICKNNNLYKSGITNPIWDEGVGNVFDLQITSSAFDLSGATSNLTIYFSDTICQLVGYTILYSEASSGDAGVAINIGRYGDGVALDSDYFDMTTSLINKTLGQTTYIGTTALTQSIIGNGYTLTCGVAGGKVGTGEVIIILKIAQLSSKP